MRLVEKPNTMFAMVYIYLITASDNSISGNDKLKVNYEIAVINYCFIMLFIDNKKNWAPGHIIGRKYEPVGFDLFIAV